MAGPRQFGPNQRRSVRDYQSLANSDQRRRGEVRGSLDDSSVIEPWTVAACAHPYRRDLPDVDLDLIGAAILRLRKSPM
jgi:hypothetical protein